MIKKFIGTAVMVLCTVGGIMLVSDIIKNCNQQDRDKRDVAELNCSQGVHYYRNDKSVRCFWCKERD